MDESKGRTAAPPELPALFQLATSRPGHVAIALGVTADFTLLLGPWGVGSFGLGTSILAGLSLLAIAGGAATVLALAAYRAIALGSRR